MLRVLFFIAVVALFGIGFAWIADTPGSIVMTVAGREITVSLMVAAVALVGIVVAIMLTWWVLNVVVTSPQRMQRFFRARRRDRGYQSLSTGMIAAGAGDSVTARRMLKQATGLLNATTEPLIQVLEVQATIAEGHHTEARKKFEGMLDDPELRILGLRGLYMEAKRLGDRNAAKHYAEKAAELAPHLAWAGTAALELKTAAGDWDGALRLLENQKKAKQLEAEPARRKRAVLLTALSRELLEKDPSKAKSAGLEAHRLAPAFAPAAVVAAQACFRLNDLRRGVHVLEATWRKTPHPEIALAYVNARPGDSAFDRHKRAQKLARLKPNNIDSSMIVAQMAMEAGEFADARKAVAAILRNEPREGAFMLMADIEDRETGDQGKVREWLARAVRAQRDPAWTADGYVSETWEPVSPISGRLDAFEWKVPVERLGPVVANDLDPMTPGGRAAAAEAPVTEALEAPAEEPAAAEEAVEEKEAEAMVIDAEIVDAPASESEPAPKAAPPVPPKPETPKETAPGAVPAAEPVTTDAVTEEAVVDEPEPPKAEPAKSEAAKTETPKVEPSKPQPPKAEASKAEPPRPEPPKPPAKPKDAGAQDAAEDIRPPLPDDPGIDPDAQPDEPSRRFRLF
ncbi:heme biosynthesis HemY N-terminal domain-containing protein [Oricola sp.]|uniref:heme biosynthesis protein HemY n=1 Tax=Oricola sp. TaxID=1979950 RepID=UPI0025CCA1F3|nr:heme biosynthesis HemY N-terminal domain-containing protein [Oricola sp.]MCI5075513.1 heme biosynthesis protein HemY [Oricola sp.]